MKRASESASNKNSDEGSSPTEQIHKKYDIQESIHQASTENLKKKMDEAKTTKKGEKLSKAAKKSRDKYLNTDSSKGYKDLNSRIKESKSQEDAEGESISNEEFKSEKLDQDYEVDLPQVSNVEQNKDNQFIQGHKIDQKDLSDIKQYSDDSIEKQVEDIHVEIEPFIGSDEHNAEDDVIEGDVIEYDYIEIDHGSDNREDSYSINHEHEEVKEHIEHKDFRPDDILPDLDQIHKDANEENIDLEKHNNSDSKRKQSEGIHSSHEETSPRKDIQARVEFEHENVDERFEDDPHRKPDAKPISPSLKYSKQTNDEKYDKINEGEHSREFEEIPSRVEGTLKEEILNQDTASKDKTGLIKQTPLKEDILNQETVSKDKTPLKEETALKDKTLSKIKETLPREETKMNQGLEINTNENFKGLDIESQNRQFKSVKISTYDKNLRPEYDLDRDRPFDSPVHKPFTGISSYDFSEDSRNHKNHSSSNKETPKNETENLEKKLQTTQNLEDLLQKQNEDTKEFSSKIEIGQEPDLNDSNSHGQLNDYYEFQDDKDEVNGRMSPAELDGEDVVNHQDLNRLSNIDEEEEIENQDQNRPKAQRYDSQNSVDDVKQDKDSFIRHSEVDREIDRYLNEDIEETSNQDRHVVANEADQPGIFDQKEIDDENIKEFDEHSDDILKGDKPMLERDFTFKRRRPKEERMQDPANVQMHHSDNLFLPSGEDDEQSPIQFQNSTRNVQEGEATGKFGSGHQMIKFGGKASQEELKGGSYAQQYIQRKAEEKMKNRHQKYSPRSNELRDNEVELKRISDKNQQNNRSGNKDYPFDVKESRIEGSIEHDSHNDPNAYSGTKGNFYGRGNYTMHDDSFNEINEFAEDIPGYRPNYGPHGIRDMRGPSLDSEEYEFNKLQQNINTKNQIKNKLRESYPIPKYQNDRILNSHSAHHLPENNGRFTPDTISISNFDKRKYTGESIDRINYDPSNKLYRQYDETATSVDMDYSLLDANEPLIIDKGIMKFHPGFSVNYVSRWVHVTRTVIRFYKNYYHSVCNFRRPLAVIPLSAVGSIKSFKFIPPKSNAMRHLGKNLFDQNQFEIVLKEDFEAIHDLNKRKREVEDLKYELELIKKLEFQNQLRSKYKRYRKKYKKSDRFSKSPAPTFRFFLENQQEEIKKLSRSHPRISVYSKLYEDDMSRIDAKMNKSHEFLRVDHSIISRGRKSDFEAAGDKSAISIDEHYVHTSRSKTPSKSKSPKKNGIIRLKPSKKRCKTPFDSTLIVDGHLMPIRVNKKKKEGKSTLRIGKKEKSKNNGANWSKRETDWFKFERRFILATKSNEEKKKWVKTLRGLIPK